ncbi:MAG TPA: glycerol-3-phosphate acyltransferase [Anaerolineales bacterium]|nr:glycerol-3-phosphate acyltransferase [Anaerolineales bacterium]HRF50974.1 glycerol-3-phosphate acyltransferase [Anaerolineales bacterium]
MTIALLTVLGFASGSVPYAWLIGRWRLGRDIRSIGDGNPGATNVLRAGDARLFLVAALLDGFKGAIPVALAYWGLQIRGWELVPIAFAPLLGHAFSPWLKGQGGKAVATTFGIWAGLTGPVAPIVFGALLGTWFWALAPSGWALLAAFACLGLHLALSSAEPAFGAIWLANAALLSWKFRQDLATLPRLRVERISAWLHH